MPPKFPDNFDFKNLFKAFENAFESVEITDIDGKILYVNKQFETTSGYTREEVIGKTPEILQDGNKNNGIDQILWSTIRQGHVWHGQFWNKRKDGTPYREEARISPIMNEKGDIQGYLGMKSDITEKVANQERAKALKAVKTEFMSLASHQLRTPLTSINWYLEMLLAGDVGTFEPQQKEFLQKVYEGSQRMVEMVNTLLTISRIEGGKIDPHYTKVDIVSFLKNCIEDCHPLAQEKHCPLSVQLPQKELLTDMDVALGKTLFEHLIQNSIKYSEGKPVIIKLEENDDGFTVHIEDHGIGIPEKFHDHIFDKFSRAKNALHRETNGSGMGLYLSKLITHLFDGKIWFTSQLDKGSTFSVHLPQFHNTSSA